MTIDEWLAPLRERNLIPTAALSAFVVGSAARGWHNVRSDFDIYVVTVPEHIPDVAVDTIPAPLDPPFVRSRNFFEGDMQWEVTYWLVDQFDQLLAKVSWDVYEGGGVAASDMLSSREELWLSRLQNNLPLLGEDWLRKRRERLSRSAFRSIVVVRSLSEADDAVEDALGQMESGDLVSATMSARIAFGHAVDALLEGEGEYGSHMVKWRPNRFKMVAPAALSFDEYWGYETMRDYDPSNPRRWINDVLTVCQDIAMRVETS